MWFLIFLLYGVHGEYVQNFEIKENYPPGTKIGVVGSGLRLPSPPYLIVPLSGSPENDLLIDQETGEIRTKVKLDRELTSRYSLSAIPRNGDTISVIIQVLDDNDNAPMFPQDFINMDIPENTPRGTRRPLLPAVDKDLNLYSTRRYEFVSGNERGDFSLKTEEDPDGLLRLDLVVDGNLDRESVENYELVIRAFDGGNPPKTGTMTVNVRIQDLNDNPPLFDKQRYFTNIPEDMPLGSSVLRVEAKDADAKQNGRIAYSINRRQSDKDRTFAIDKNTGLILLDRRLNFERKRVHEIVVVAKDGGEVPQETSAFITVRISGDDGLKFSEESSSTEASSQHIRIVPNPPSLYENTPPGQGFAQVILEKWESQRFNFELTPVQNAFRLIKNGSGIFLSNTKTLDYEKTNVYPVRIKATDPLFPEDTTELAFKIFVKDSNDHHPVFETQEYYASLEESVEPGSSVLKVKARDEDKGENGRISYFLNYEGSKYSDWFKISESTGLITTQTFLDCEMESSPSVVIVATDNGYPSPFSATATLTVSVSDVNDNQPLFESSFYEASLPENQRPGDCFLKVHAIDMDCGANSIVKYSLKDDGDDDKKESFMIESDSGNICLSKELDHERRDAYDFTIIAKDRGGLSTSTMVKVQVMDVNDNAPTFAPSEYFAKIDRNYQELDSPLLQIHAYDDDSIESSQIEYSIISGNVEDAFILNKDTGLLQLAKKVPSNLNRFELQIEAVDKFGLTASQNGGGFARVEILVSDDSEDLKIKKMLYEFSVPEDISPYSGIGSVSPLEESVMGTMTIYGMSTKVQYFSLDSKTGFLRTESRLDHETNPEVVINVKVEKGGRYGFCQIIIHVKDVNDNTPEFGPEIALASVPEDFDVGGIVYVASARDADKGANGEIHYRLQGGDTSEESKFSLNSKSGELKLSQPLDYEVQETHEVSIEAVDNGNPPLKGTLKLKISVHDVNDNNPEFYDALPELQISENHPVDTRIYAFKAKDMDRGKNGRVSYSITDNEYITILPNSGVLILKKPLDREANHEFDLVVIARDHGNPSLSSEFPFKLIVSDKNDNSPKFDKDFYEFSVLENLPPEAVIGTVSAYDNDDGPNGDISYHLKTPVDNFKINKVTGLIMTSKSLDREEKDFYEILVEATDGGTPTRSSQTLVQINVTDVNDNSPYLIEPYGSTFYVKEGSLAGTLIGKLFARDPDEDNEVIFSTQDTSLIQVSPNGDVRLSRGLDYALEEFVIAIKISDKGSPSRFLETDLTISVVGQDDERQYGQKSLTQMMSVVEGVPIGTKIGSISSVGRKGARFIMEEDEISSMFMVDLETGDVITIGELDADTKAEYEFHINVQEEDNLSVTLQIHLENINDERPVFEADPLVLQVPENTVVGTVVTTVVAKDRDIDEVVQYELIEESPNRDAFSLDQTSGALTLVHELDYEKDKEFLVVVRAVDSSSRHTTEMTIWVTVMDANDNEPIFISSSNLQIFSDVPMNVSVMKILAVDYDSGKFGEVAYSILNGNAAEIYHIDDRSGDLTLLKPPKSTTYTLTLRAHDGGGLYADTTLTIDVKINNDSTPRFLRSVTEVIVPEDTEPDTTILSLDLKQRSSSSDGVLFSLLKGTGAFYIDEYSGRINTLVRLDREIQDSYALVVQVTSEDTAVFSDTTVINVKISDVNDNSPLFGQSCRDLSFPENMNANGSQSFIQAIVAHDKDDGDNGRITYKLEDDFESKFFIHSTSGRLFSHALNREEQEKYSLEIIASDLGTPSKSSRCSISLRVLDANDNPPIFSRKVYYARLKEDAPIGTEVLKVFANDIDEDLNAQVRYSLLPSNGTTKSFAIDSVTGSIVTTGKLDRERSDSDVNILHVMATDKGMENVLYGTAQVEVTILDVNDNAPEFEFFPFRVNISRSPSVGSPLLKLSAFDPDSGSNGELQFALSSDNGGVFELSPEEGILTLARETMWKSGSVLNLEVVVSDKGVPPLSSKGLIQILVDGGPTVSLSFQKRIYRVELYENPSSGAEVTQVQAVRSDGRKQRVIYTFHHGNEGGVFEINSNSGLIRVKDPERIDYEINKEFNLTILGKGLGEEELNAYSTIIIDVKNINDNAPRFPQLKYLAKVIEGYDKGAEVLRLEALDQDDDESSEITYEIVDGNVDGAFTISPLTSGIVRTNTVLDREIREEYLLTVSAKDNGSPSLSGETKVKIFVIDANDNQPHFPPLRPIYISKATPPGSLVSNLRANDIDMYPMLTYKLDAGSEYFSINSLNGQLYLLTTPDFETQGDRFNISVQASDTKHVARASTQVIFKVDAKYCERNSRFNKPVYEFLVSSNITYPYSAGKIELVGSASECDDIHFQIDEDSDQNTFSVSASGEILVHHGNWKKSSLIIRALADSKSLVIASTVVILHQKLLGKKESTASLSFKSLPSELEVSGKRLLEPILQVKTNKPPIGLFFELFPEDSSYKIDSTSGNVYQVSQNASRREKVIIKARPAGEVSPFIEESLLIKSLDEDITEEQSYFIENKTSISLQEDVNVEKTSIPLCRYHNSQNGGAPYVRIISGNEYNIFTLVEESLTLMLNKRLDYEHLTIHNIIIRMGSSRLSLCHVQVIVINVNDNEPEFPLPISFARLAENSPKGSSVPSPIVIDKDRNDSLTFWTNSYEFKVDERTGQIYSRQVFDYEVKNSYTFKYYVNDSVGHTAESRVTILIQSEDEYPPVFEEGAYFFSMPGLANPGDVIGQVKASDQDSGPDGRVFYYFSPKNDYFGIDESRGVITVIKDLDTDVFNGQRREKRSPRELKLVLKAKSKRLNSLEASTIVSIRIEESLLPVAVASSESSVAAWVQGVIVGIILLLIILGIGIFIHIRRKKKTNGNLNKFGFSSSSNNILSVGNRTTSSSSGDNLDMELSQTSGSGGVLSRFPPQYSEIVLDYDHTSGPGKPIDPSVNPTRSEISEKSHRSASSGRGSVEEGEDEDVEIRMINEGSYLSPDGSLFHIDDDKLSQSSVQNSKDYFARLGIDIRKPPNLPPNAGAPSVNPGENIHNFDGSSIYNRIPEDAMSEKNSIVSGATKQQSLIYGSNPRTGQPSLTGSLSSIVHSEEELAGSYNWDYLLDWGPQYQPLAHVFKEISRLKDSSAPRGAAPVATSGGPQGKAFSPLQNTRLMLSRSARSPISHDALSQSALSPSFHPALSPLATKSPSVSPLALPLSRRPPPPPSSNAGSSKRRENITSVI